MAITDNKKIMPGTNTYAARGIQWGELFEEIGLIKDGSKYYLDGSGGIGFDVDTSSNKIKIIYDVDKYAELNVTNYSSTETVYWQVSKGGSVVYIYNVDPVGSNATSSMPNVTVILAKSPSDNRCIIHKGYIYYSGGVIPIPTDTTNNAATPYTATKMPVLFGDGTFDELYRLITAGQFALQYTYVMFDNTPCRIATVSGAAGKNSSCLPGFAFLVSEEG